MPNFDTKRVEPANEDTIQCLFFSTKIKSDVSEWEEFCKQLNLSIQTLTKQYIWQRDEFQVYFPININDDETPFHLRSTTCFGDNIEDEWYIVYILFELTRLYEHLIVRVQDNDGDFLLIEAAYFLPAWVRPETSENRVFIYNNHIHIIPHEVISVECTLELKGALNLVSHKPELTQASEEIEKAILDRIGMYPEKAIKGMHKAVCKLPRDLATLLTLNPSLIAPIVNAYCHHDIFEAKCCKNINFEDCVTVNVTFTKFLYAMLVNSKLIPYVKQKAGLDNDKKNILGLKLLCGFQIIMNNSSKTNLFGTKEFNVFINNLKKNGYFKHNMEGSKEYNQLLCKAKNHFSTIECPVSSHVSHKIRQLMSTDSYLKVKESIGDSNITENDCLGDSEDWMNIQPDQLNDLLETRYGKKSKLNKNDIISSEALTVELSNFLKQTSDFEGIETGNETSEDNDIEFEASQYVDCLEKMLQLLSTGNNVKDVDCSDSGDSSDCDSDDDVKYDSARNCDQELKSKLHAADSGTVFDNIVKSVREEKAYTGPTSNLLRSIGVDKTDILDSDDDLS